MNLPEKTVYHIIGAQQWSAALKKGFYAPESLQQEGFIHLSFRPQVLDVARRFYAEEKELLVLEINIKKMEATVIVEQSGADGNFPHLYGKLNLNAVEKVHSIRQNETGVFYWNESGG